MVTLAAVAGAEPPAGTDGLSLLPTLLGQGEQRRHPYLYWEACGPKQDVVQQAVRLGDWKAVRDRAGAAWGLFDLKADPGEGTDVAAAHPDVLARVAAVCREARSPERAFGPAPKEGAADYVR